MTSPAYTQRMAGYRMVNVRLTIAIPEHTVKRLAEVLKVSETTALRKLRERYQLATYDLTGSHMVVDLASEKGPQLWEADPDSEPVALAKRGEIDLDSQEPPVAALLAIWEQEKEARVEQALRKDEAASG